MSQRAQPRHAFFAVLGHEVHVTEWGDRSAPPLVMWHGLARTSRDFDELAAGFAADHFVICPDTIGRGQSSWSENPEAEYSIEHYARIALGVMDHYGMAKAGWFGTSMGGLIGMRIASGPMADRLRYLIINDIGPEVPQPAIDRILAYAADLPSFATVSEGEAWLRTTYAPFGAAEDQFWQRMAMTSLRRMGNGRLTLHYDPKIVVQFTASAEELLSWERYDRIGVPMHVFQGANSDILSPQILQRMCASGPRPTSTTMQGCGHAPSLSLPGDVGFVREVVARLQSRCG